MKIGDVISFAPNPGMMVQSPDDFDPQTGKYTGHICGFMEAKDGGKDWVVAVLQSGARMFAGRRIPSVVTGLKPYPLSLCHHPDFKASVRVGRLTDGEHGPVTGYTADVRIECTGCGAPFQFLNLKTGIDSHAPSVSVDGLEARLPISPFDRKVTPPKRIRLSIETQN